MGRESHDAGSRRRSRRPLAAAVAACVGCGVGAQSAALAQAQMLDARLRAEVVASGLGAGQLQCSTGIMFAGPRLMLAVSRVDGRVRRVDLVPGAVATPGATVLDLEIVTADPTDDQSEFGVQAIVPEPNFAATGGVLIKYDLTRFAGRDTQQGEFNHFSSPALNVIDRFTWDPAGNGGGGALVFDRRLRAIPLNTRYHHGGPIVFGHDGAFFTSYGDLRNPGYLSTNNPGGFVDDAGAIVRFAPDGTPAPDNPFGPAHGAPAGTEAWFAYGTRNTFGLAVDPLTGDLWTTDNGESIYDEVNRVPPASNLGWSRLMGPAGHPRQPDTMAGLVLVPASPASVYRDPAFAWFQTTGVTALHFLAGSALGPAWDDALAVGNFNTGFLFLFRLNEARDGLRFTHPGLQDRVDDRVSFATNPIGTEAAELLWARALNPLFRGVVATCRGPDGLPYLLTAQGDVVRVRRTCPVDVNADGVLTPDDLADVIAAYFAVPPLPIADIDASGVVDPDDLSDAIAMYFGGC